MMKNLVNYVISLAMAVGTVALKTVNLVPVSTTLM